MTISKVVLMMCDGMRGPSMKNIPKTNKKKKNIIQINNNNRTIKPP
jgi:hypothetical protein